MLDKQGLARQNSSVKSSNVDLHPVLSSLPEDAQAQRQD